jgi:multicomponent Na+:H+ antiporter subunit D
MIRQPDVLPLFVALPMAGAFLISILPKKIKLLPDIIGNMVTTLLLAFAVYALWLSNIYGVMQYSVGAWKPPIGISLVLDGLSVFMLFIINLVAFCVSVYSINYMEQFTDKWKFYALFLLMIAGMNGVVMTGDIFNLFVFLEITSIASYALVAFGTERHELEAAFKYAVMGSVGSLFILLSIVFLYSYTATLNMADIGRAIMAEKGSSSVIVLVSGLLLMGFGLKAALVPFHGWLPDAHPSAPAPISAMLSAVLVKSLGIYAMFRIFYNVIGLSPSISSVLMFLGALSMLVGGFLSIGQWDFKRLLAYSTISQIGYIVFGLALGTPLGILGGIFHLFNHSIMKSLIFLDAGAVEYSTGTRNLKNMGGLAEKMPVTGSTSLVASMSLSGIPPFGGFWSKLIIIIAAVQADHYGYALCAVIASVLTLAAFMKLMKYAFWGSLTEKWSQLKEVPFFMRFSLVVLAFICLIGGILLLPGIKELFLQPVVNVLQEGTKYAGIMLER